MNKSKSGVGASEAQFHGAEIVYALDNLNNDPGPIGSGTISSTDQHYADMVSSYWANFVKNGDPNMGSEVNWPAWDYGNQQYLEFGEQLVVKHHLLKYRLDALQEFLDAEE